MSSTLPRVPVDPDLENALRALEQHVTHLSLLNGQIKAINRGGDGYKKLGPLHDRRAACLDNITGWAKRIGVKPRAMRIFAEEWLRLRNSLRRKPTLAQLQKACIVKQAILREEDDERDALRALADFAASCAAERRAAGDEAVTYLEKCSG